MTYDGTSKIVSNNNFKINKNNDKL